MITAEIIVDSAHKKDINDQNEINSLIARAKDYDADAIEVLGEIAEPQAVEPLLESLRNCSENAKKILIIEALRKIGDNRALEPLIIAMKNETVSEVRMVLADTIEQLST